MKYVDTACTRITIVWTHRFSLHGFRQCRITREAFNNRPRPAESAGTVGYWSVWTRLSSPSAPHWGSCHRSLLNTLWLSPFSENCQEGTLSLSAIQIWSQSPLPAKVLLTVNHWSCKFLTLKKVAWPQKILF